MLRDPATGEFHLEGGALVLADGETEFCSEFDLREIGSHSVPSLSLTVELLCLSFDLSEFGGRRMCFLLLSPELKLENQP